MDIQVDHDHHLLFRNKKMKLTKQTLKRIIKEELNHLMLEQQAEEAAVEAEELLRDPKASKVIDDLSKKPEVAARKQNLKIRLGYPLARGPNEKTGDTLQIKCVEFVPPENGATMGVSTENLLFDVTREDGTVDKNVVLGQKEREDYNMRNPNNPIGDPKLNVKLKLY